MKGLKNSPALRLRAVLASMGLASALSGCAPEIVLPVTISATDRLAAEMADPGGIYDEPVALRSPGWETTRCAAVTIADGVEADVYWPSGDVENALPVVVLLCGDRDTYVKATGRPYRRYVPVVSWAADIASRGMAVVVPDIVSKMDGIKAVLDWIDWKGLGFGLDSHRMAFFGFGPEAASIPYVLHLDGAQYVRTVAVFYGGFQTAYYVFPSGVAFRLVGTGDPDDPSGVSGEMDQLVRQLQVGGNEVDHVVRPELGAYFDWIAVEGTPGADAAREVLASTLDFFESRLR